MPLVYAHELSSQCDLYFLNDSVCVYDISFCDQTCG